jgi:nitroreductase
VTVALSVAEAVKARRSIRHFEERAVEPDLVEALAEAALRAPTSRNLRSWHFVFVDDRAQLTALSTAKSAWAEPIARAPLAVVVCGNEFLSDCWVEDASIAAAFIQLTATSLGLGSCWVQMRERHDAEGRPSEERVREIAGLPENQRVLCVLAIGHPAEAKPPLPDDRLSWEKVERPGA